MVGLMSECKAVWDFIFFLWADSLSWSTTTLRERRILWWMSIRYLKRPKITVTRGEDVQRGEGVCWLLNVFFLNRETGCALGNQTVVCNKITAFILNGWTLSTDRSSIVPVRSASSKYNKNAKYRSTVHTSWASPHEIHLRFYLLDWAHVCHSFCL